MLRIYEEIIMVILFNALEYFLNFKLLDAG